MHETAQRGLSDFVRSSGSIAGFRSNTAGTALRGCQHVLALVDPGRKIRVVDALTSRLIAVS